MTKREYANLFRAAARLIESGWCQGNMVKLIDGKLHRCLYGGIHKACEDSFGNTVPAYHGHTYGMAIILRELIQPDGGCLVDWNDSQYRTKEHVVHALRLAARMLDHGWTPKVWPQASKEPSPTSLRPTLQPQSGVPSHVQ